jgi:hypothetical protein
MKTYGEVEILIEVFVTSALIGGDWSPSRMGRFNSEEKTPSTHWKGGWVSPRTGLDDVERCEILPLPGLELQPLGRQTRSQSLYRLRYPDSPIM